MAAVTVRSLINPHMPILMDPFAVNPMLDDAEQSAPATVALARATDGPPPQMFEVGGDLPLITASGVDPSILRSVPWRLRHLAAAEGNLATVYNMVQASNDETLMTAPLSPGLEAYIGRFRDWLAGKSTVKVTNADPSLIEAAEADLFQSVFGATSDARDAKVAAVNAANPPKPTTAAERAAYNLGRAQR